MKTRKECIDLLKMHALVFLFLLLMCNLTYSSCISSSVSTAVQVSKEANEARQLVGRGRVMDKKKAALIEQLKMEQDSIKS